MGSNTTQILQYANTEFKRTMILSGDKNTDPLCV